MEFVHRPRRLKPSVFASCPLAPSQPPATPGAHIVYLVDRPSEYSLVFQVLPADFDFSLPLLQWEAHSICPPANVNFFPHEFLAWPYFQSSASAPYGFDTGVWYGPGDGGLLDITSSSIPIDAGVAWFNGTEIAGIPLPKFAASYPPG